MTHKSAVDKAREKAKAQITSAEKHQKASEFEAEEARRVLTEQLAEKRAKKLAERKQKIEAVFKKISAERHEMLKEKIKSDWLYAQRESLHLTIVLSSIVILIVYLLLF